MATKKKMLQAAAGNAGGGGGLDVDEVFSTYLYTGNNSGGSTPIQTITNEIDLAGEGGLVWLAGRSNATGHNLYDTERGVRKYLQSNSASAESTAGTGAGLTSFNSDGFTLGSSWNTENFNGYTYASWSFLKSKRFFDVVTWTGDGTNNRKIPHNLGSEVGCYMVKQVNDSRDWSAYHRGVNGGTNPEQYIMVPSGTDAQNDVDYWNDTAPTATEFTINNYAPINESGGNYIAYLWAHNDGDGEFGPDADQDIIKCGSYTGTGSAGNNVDLGFEPQWLMIKRTNSAGNWQMADVMRGMPNNGGAGAYQRLSANLSNAEVNGQEGPIPTSTGFVLNSTSSDTNGSGGTYIYIAIRRGPLAPPDSATDVFDVALRSATSAYSVGFPTDLWIGKETTRANGSFVSDRLRGGTKYLLTPSTGAEQTDGGGIAVFDLQDSFSQGAASQPLVNWNWKRAPKYMDCVAYFGNSTAGRTVEHGLTVPPEMMWVKRRNSSTDWRVYHKDIGNTHNLQLNSSAAKEDALYWNDTTPTNTVFTLNNFGDVNGSGQTYIAYLFASLDGVSKLGSVTQSGTTNVDCGFSSGARFVLLKRTDASGDWYVWDSERGIVSGNDPYLLLNSTAAQVAVQDYINPLSSGFTITSNFDFGNYIFYAIA